MIGRSITRTQTQAPSRSKTSAQLDRTKTRGTSQSRMDEASTEGMLSAPAGDFSRENIRVAARFRPVKSNFDRCEDIQIRESTAFTTNPDREFPLDKIFTDQSTQREVFEWTCQDSLQDALKGINVTILAYGQTGSGKTHTMFGKLDSEQNLGIIPRCCMTLFDLMENDEDGVEFTCSCSMLEIYREEMNDLLSPQVVSLHIKENRTGGVYVEGLTHEYVTGGEQVLDLIDLGNKAKVVASTKMNSESSRSHTIVVLDVVKKTRDGATLKGRLNLVDLAGSEKIKKTGAQGDTLEEAKKINLSLTALSHCIYALTKSDPHVPFRSSKLTRFLQNSLGGNSKTSLIVACASEAESFHETLSSLEFATRAKKIKNRVAANTELSPEALKDRLQAMEFELQALQEYVRELETVTQSHGIQLPKPVQGRLSLPMLSAPQPDTARWLGQNNNNNNGGVMSPTSAPLNSPAKRTVSAEPMVQGLTVVVDTTRSRAMTETEVDQLRDVMESVDRDNANLSLKDRFNERLQLLALRAKTRVGGVAASEAKERASHLAQAPDLDRQMSFEELLSVPPPPPVSLFKPRQPVEVEVAISSVTPLASPTGELIEQRAEIQALNSEIESIYSLVLAHEEEMARFLEAKNLEVAALKLQLEQQQLISHDSNHRSASPVSDSMSSPAMQRLGTMDGGNKGLHGTKSGKQLMANTTFRSLKTPSELIEAQQQQDDNNSDNQDSNNNTPTTGTEQPNSSQSRDHEDKADLSPSEDGGDNNNNDNKTNKHNNANDRNNEQASLAEASTMSFVSVNEFKGVVPEPEEVPKSEAFINLQNKLQEQNQALELQQGVLVKQQDVLAMLQRKVIELTKENYALKDENGSLTEQLKSSQARTGELEHELAFLKVHARGNNKPYDRAASDHVGSPKIVPVLVPGRHRRASAAALSKFGSTPLDGMEEDSPPNVLRSHTVQLPPIQPMVEPVAQSKPAPTQPPPPPPPPAVPAGKKSEPPTTEPKAAAATKDNSDDSSTGAVVEVPGDLSQHRAVPKKLLCLCTREPISEQSYCEYQTWPSMKWHPAKYAEDVVRSLLAGGFTKYLKDVELASRDCAAVVRRLVKDGPPIWIRDANAMPIPTGDTHVCTLWFARTNTQLPAKLEGALDGQPREALWAIQKEILAAMESWEAAHAPAAPVVNDDVTEKENSLEQIAPVGGQKAPPPPRHPRTQARKSTGATLASNQEKEATVTTTAPAKPNRPAPASRPHTNVRR